MNDKKEITGMSILSCIETILSVNDEQPHTLSALEPIVLEVIIYIFSSESGSGKQIRIIVFNIFSIIICL